jgi:regulatory protein
MTDPSRDELTKAKISAFRLLKIRQRSVLELRERLLAKKIEKATVDATVAFLVEKKFLDDRAFAKAWIRDRQARPYGPQRIRMELRKKGIHEEIIREELASAFGEFAEEDVVLELARRRAARYQGIDPVKRKKRVFDFLARRGFGLDAITKAVKKL